MAKGISETAFASQVEDLLKMFGWRWIHFRPAWTGRGYRTPIRGWDPDGYKGMGFPDYVAVRPPRLIFAELKDQYTKPEAEQEAWLNMLRECEIKPVKLGIALSVEVYLWRPSQIEEIAEILRQGG